MMGTPARQVGWVSAFGERIPLPLVGCGSWECYRTGDRYSLVGDSLTREPGTIDLLKYDFGMKLERLSI
jgi:UDP-2-acetamido-3-amino-2,3-dideoxy-glucuronate N-acetyltransferase